MNLMHKSRDQEMFTIGSLLKTFHSTGAKDHVIFEKSEVVKDNGDPYTVFTPYSKKWKAKLSIGGL